MSVSWERAKGEPEGAGPWLWHADGYWLKYGPELRKSCMTKLGARFAAWRRKRT